MIQKIRKEGGGKYDCIKFINQRKQINSNFTKKSFTVTDIFSSDRVVVAYGQGSVYTVYGYKWCTHTSEPLQLLKIGFDKMPKVALMEKIPVNTGNGNIADSEAWVTLGDTGIIYCNYSTNDGFLFFNFTYIV